MALGARIKKMREVRGYAIEQVAQAAGMSAEELNAVEAGERLINTLEIAKICRYACISVPQLFEAKAYDSAAASGINGSKR